MPKPYLVDEDAELDDMSADPYLGRDGVYPDNDPANFMGTSPMPGPPYGGSQHPAADKFQQMLKTPPKPKWWQIAAAAGLGAGAGWMNSSGKHMPPVDVSGAVNAISGKAGYDAAIKRQAQAAQLEHQGMVDKQNETWRRTQEENLNSQIFARTEAAKDREERAAQLKLEAQEKGMAADSALLQSGATPHTPIPAREDTLQMPPTPVQFPAPPAAKAPPLGGNWKDSLKQQSASSDSLPMPPEMGPQGEVVMPPPPIAPKVQVAAPPPPPGLLKNPLTGNQFNPPPSADEMERRKKAADASVRAAELKDIGVEAPDAILQYFPTLKGKKMLTRELDEYAKAAKTLKEVQEGAGDATSVVALAMRATDPKTPPEVRKRYREALDLAKPPSAGPDLEYRKTQRVDHSYQFNVNELNRISKPIEDLAGRFTRLRQTIAQGTPQSDAFLAPEMLTVMAGGQGSGLRMNEAEIARIVGGRSKLQSLQATLQQWTTNPAKANSITPEQRQQMKALIDAVGGDIEKNLGVINDARSQLLAAQTPEEHRRIVASTHTSVAGDSQKKDQTADGLPQGGGKAIDKDTAKKFYEAAGGDPRKGQQMAIDHGWKVD